MSSVFRMATMQAIKEIIEDSSVSGRFGNIVTEESMDDICKRVVDLFEMTLELRAKTSEIFSGAVSGTQSQAPAQLSQQRASAKSHRGHFSDGNSLPSTKNAAEIYAPQTPVRTREGSHSPVIGLDLKLPRQRFDLTQGEKEKLSRR